MFFLTVYFSDSNFKRQNPDKERTKCNYKGGSGGLNQKGFNISLSLAVKDGEGGKECTFF